MAALETAAPTATATPTAPAPSATPTRLTATKTIHSTPTPTALPAAPVARTPGPTVAPDLALEFSKLKPNQYLGVVAQRYGVSLDELVKLSGIETPTLSPSARAWSSPTGLGRNTPDPVCPTASWSTAPVTSILTSTPLWPSRAAGYRKSR